MATGPKRPSPAAKLAATYAAFGALWILVSDNLLAGLFHDPAILTMAQTSKGWLFVAASAVLILVLGTRLLTALDSTEHRYRMLFADSPLPMLLYDPATGDCIEANAAACRHLGYDGDSLAAMKVLDLLVPEDRPDAGAALHRGHDRINGVTSTRTMQCGDGRRIRMELRGNTVYYRDRLLRLLVLTDITARMQAEGALIRTMDKLARHETERAQLAHALAHDLREPIRQVAGFVQLLGRRYQGRLSAEADQWIGFATEGVHRLNALLSDLHAFTEAKVPRAEPVPMAEILAEVVEMLEVDFQSSGAVLCIGEMPVLHTDRRNLAVVLLCLIENSIKFRAAERPCRICVTGEAVGGGWRFTVSDNGQGIEPEYRETVFALFGRLHTRDRIAGNGTGLAMARKLIEAGGGLIWIAEARGDGVAISFTLPDSAAASAHQH